VTDGKFRVVIAGGGVAALEAALALRALAEDRVAIHLIAPDPYFWYRPLSVMTPFGGGRVEPLELTELGRFCSATYERDAVALVDPVAGVAHTARGAAHRYDALVIACGVQLRDALAGAQTFCGPGDSGVVGRLVEEVEANPSLRLVFAVPAGATWPLPLYELALLTAARLAGRGVEIAFVTPEEAPLSLLGAEASETVKRLLEERGIALHVGRAPISARSGLLALSPGGSLPADRVISLPRLEGRAIPSLPYDQSGFIPTDAHGRVVGAPGVYAAGDVTDFPIKHGGLAAQQADAVAEAIAAEAGAPITPAPFRPVLHGLLLTGAAPVYMRAELVDGRAESATVANESLWWPPGKIVGRYLAPFLAERADLMLTTPAPGDSLRVDLELAPTTPRPVAAEG
jgi:sulfide:quinone oxidoreductase